MILGNIIVYSMKMDIDFEIRFISVIAFIYLFILKYELQLSTGKVKI